MAAAGATLGTSPQDRLRDLSRREEKFGDLRLSFNYNEAGDTGTITLSHKHTEQKITFEFNTPADKAAEIIRAFHELRGAISMNGNGNKILSRLLREDAVFKAVDKLADSTTASFAELGRADAQHDAYKKFLADSPGGAPSPALHGFAVTEHPHGALPPSSDPGRKPDILTKVSNLRHGAQRLVFNEGGTSLELTLGQKNEVTITVPGGRGADAKISIELPQGLKPEDIDAKVKELLQHLQGKQASDLFTGSDTHPQGSELVSKLLEYGKLSRLENAELKGVVWSKEKVADGLIISNVKISDSVIELDGAFHAKKLVTEGATRLYLNTPGSVLEACNLDGKTTLIGNLTGLILVSPEKMACNAYGCDLRGLEIRDSLDGPARDAKWKEFKGFTYNENAISKTILEIGRTMSKSEFAKEIGEMESNFNTRPLGKMFSEIDSSIKKHPPTASDTGEETTDPVSGKKYQKYVFTDADNFREVEIQVHKAAENPKQRIKVIQKDIPSGGEAKKEYEFAELNRAASAALDLLRWKRNTVEESNGANAGKVPDSAPVTPEVVSTDGDRRHGQALADMKKKLNDALHSGGLKGTKVEAYLKGQIERDELEATEKRALTALKKNEEIADLVKRLDKRGSKKEERKDLFGDES